MAVVAVGGCSSPGDDSDDHNNSNDSGNGNGDTTDDVNVDSGSDDDAELWDRILEDYQQEVEDFADLKTCKFCLTPPDFSLKLLQY